MHTLAYVIPVQCKPYPANDENSSERILNNISATMSEREVQMLPAIPGGCKMIYPGDHTPMQKVVLQGAKMSKDTQEKLTCL